MVWACLVRVQMMLVLMEWVQRALSLGIGSIGPEGPDDDGPDEVGLEGNGVDSDGADSMGEQDMCT